MTPQNVLLQLNRCSAMDEDELFKICWHTIDVLVSWCKTAKHTGICRLQKCSPPNTSPILSATPCLSWSVERRCTARNGKYLKRWCVGVNLSVLAWASLSTPSTWLVSWRTSFPTSASLPCPWKTSSSTSPSQTYSVLKWWAILAHYRTQVNRYKPSLFTPPYSNTRFSCKSPPRCSQRAKTRQGRRQWRRRAAWSRKERQVHRRKNARVHRFTSADASHGHSHSPVRRPTGRRQSTSSSR